MKLNRTAATVISAAAVLGGPATAAPASAATAGFSDTTTGSRSVVLGSVEGFRGNRHQLLLTTVNGKVSGTSTFRSYYCPTGASISPTWVSSKCTLRSTRSLRNFSQNNETSLVGRVSSTGRSATQAGPVLAVDSAGTVRAVIGLDLKMYASAEGNEPISLTGTSGSDNNLQVSGRSAYFRYTS